MKPYVEETAIFAIGGSFLTPQDAIASSDWAAITKIAERAVEISLGFAMGRAGINCNSVDEANSTVCWFNDRFGLKPREIDISFCWRYVEAMKNQALANTGILELHVTLLARSIIWNAKVPSSVFQGESEGKIIAAYLEEEVGGFAVHLCGNGK